MADADAGRTVPLAEACEDWVPWAKAHLHVKTGEQPREREALTL